MEDGIASMTCQDKQWFRSFRAIGVQRCFGEDTKLFRVKTGDAWAVATKYQIAGFNQIFVNPADKKQEQWEANLLEAVQFMKNENVPFVVVTPVIPEFRAHCLRFGMQLKEKAIICPMMLSRMEFSLVDDNDPHHALVVEVVDDEPTLLETRRMIGDLSDNSYLCKCRADWHRIYILRDSLGGAIASTVIATILGEGAVGISGLETKEELRRQGYGKSLLRRVMNICYSEGHSKFLLASSDDGYQLYKQLGFIEVEKWNMFEVEQ